jgi:hypothetical protein
MNRIKLDDKKYCRRLYEEVLKQYSERGLHACKLYSSTFPQKEREGFPAIQPCSKLTGLAVAFVGLNRETHPTLKRA